MVVSLGTYYIALQSDNFSGLSASPERTKTRAAELRLARFSKLESEPVGFPEGYTSQCDQINVLFIERLSHSLDPLSLKRGKYWQTDRTLCGKIL